MNTSSAMTAKKIQASLGLLILTVVIVGLVVAAPNKTSAHSHYMAPGTTKVAVVKVPTDAASGNTTPYKNGTYMATGTYGSPGGPEKLYVTLTIVNGKVTNSTLVSGSNDPTSAGFQGSFIAGYKQYVIGKDITAIKIGTVGNSSLTNLGFSDALKQIEQKAEV